MPTLDQVLGQDPNNVMNTIRVDAQNAEFPLSTFTPDEAMRWKGAFGDLFWNQDGLLRALHVRRQVELAAAARAAKKTLKERTFGGFSAANTEIGISPIRPGHIGFTSNAGSGKPNNVWRFFFNAGADNNWIGAGLGAVTTAVTMGPNVFCANIGLLELTPTPLADVVKIDIGRASILPIDTHVLRKQDVPGVGNVSVVPLPVTFWGPSESVTVRVYSDAGGIAELVPLGLTYALGVVLNNYPQYTEAQRTTN